MDFPFMQNRPTYSNGCLRGNMAGRSMRIAGGIFSITGVAIVSLCLVVMPDAAVAEDRFELRSIASKEWEEISNDEIIYVYEEFFGDSEISKFKPRFCIGRAYNFDDEEKRRRIERRIREFEDQSNLREYGYSIHEPLHNSEGCRNGNHVLGAYGDVYGKYAFLVTVEEGFPVFLDIERWAEFKRFRACGGATLRTSSVPRGTRSLRIGVGLINIREENYLGSLETCVDTVLWGTLVGMGGTREYYPLLSMGFPEENLRRLATIFVKILYHPDMKFGNFKFHERKSQMTNILAAFRTNP